MKRVIVIFLLFLSTLFADEDTFNSFEAEFKAEFEASKKSFDPLSGYNRIMTGFNDYTYTMILEPTARGYRYIVANEIRIFVANFFRNLLFPVRFANNLLQGKIKNSGDELFRFALNSTLGVGGMGDPAKIICNVDEHQEDLGQTLGYYGVGAGFPIVLPFLGPSNARDTLGLIGDSFANPISYVKPKIDSITLKTYSKFNDISFHIDDYKAVKKDAIDLYPYLQDLYEKRRDYLIQH